MRSLRTRLAALAVLCCHFLGGVVAASSLVPALTPWTPEPAGAARAAAVAKGPVALRAPVLAEPSRPSEAAPSAALPGLAKTLGVGLLVSVAGFGIFSTLGPLLATEFARTMALMAVGAIGASAVAFTATRALSPGEGAPNPLALALVAALSTQILPTFAAFGPLPAILFTVFGAGALGIPIVDGFPSFEAAEAGDLDALRDPGGAPGPPGHPAGTVPTDGDTAALTAAYRGFLDAVRRGDRDEAAARLRRYQELRAAQARVWEARVRGDAAPESARRD